MKENTPSTEVEGVKREPAKSSDINKIYVRK